MNIILHTRPLLSSEKPTELEDLPVHYILQLNDFFSYVLDLTI
jgi:hypothetical protein